jgi:hypothetical protein
MDSHFKDTFLSEQRQLQALPKSTSVNYSEHFIRITRSSTLMLKRVTYTVPSRLVSSPVKVHLYDRRLDGYLGGAKTLELERVFAQKETRSRSVNYQHVIAALVQKPRAFCHSQWRAALLPTDDYHRIWRYVDDDLSAHKACLYIVRILYLAHKSHREEALGRFVLEGIDQGRLPSVFDSEDRFMLTTPAISDVTVKQHALSRYQALLQGGRHE